MISGGYMKVSKMWCGTEMTAELKMENGVYVWASNGRVPPADAIAEYEIDKLPGFDKALHDKARDEQTQKALSDYRKAMKNWEPSGEEMAEMRAAFGPGATMVNIVTGKRFKV
jgi:hypothetical protein